MNDENKKKVGDSPAFPVLPLIVVSVIIFAIGVLLYKNNSSRNTTQVVEEKIVLDENLFEKYLAMGSENIKGKEIFLNRCRSCHGESGQGNIGPNLTDDFWIHGKGNPIDILTMIKSGAPRMGMPAWKGMLNDDEFHALAAFVYKMAGTNPPGAKPPQGIQYAK